MPDKAPWLTYRPELKVLDCTVRDGGLVNNHQFDDKFVQACYAACIAAGLDYMEIGYKNSPAQFPRDEFGPWKFCDESDLRRAIGDHDAQATGLKLSAMADAGKSDWATQIIPADQSVLDMIRVAFYDHQLSEAVEMIHHAHEMGYEVCANLMAVTTVGETELDQVLESIRESCADVMVIVDSFGHLFREQVDRLVKKYQKAMEGTGKEIGMHAHNNLQLAFANTIEAIILGVNRVDGTMYGMGRGAGNCHTELLVGFLKNPKFKLRPVLQFLQDVMLPMRQQCEWGALVPYNITAKYNIHPRSAIGWRKGETPDDFVAFFDKIIADV